MATYLLYSSYTCVAAYVVLCSLLRTYFYLRSYHCSTTVFRSTLATPSVPQKERRSLTHLGHF